MKRKCTNAYMVSQCKMFLSNMAIFKNGLELAAKKNDGVTDPDEARMIKEINRDLEKLRVKIEQYINNYQFEYIRDKFRQYPSVFALGVLQKERGKKFCPLWRVPERAC